MNTYNKGLLLWITVQVLVWGGLVLLTMWLINGLGAETCGAFLLGC